MKWMVASGVLLLLFRIPSGAENFPSFEEAWKYSPEELKIDRIWSSGEKNH